MSSIIEDPPPGLDCRWVEPRNLGEIDYLFDDLSILGGGSGNVIISLEHWIIGATTDRTFSLRQVLVGKTPT